jgi:hypothetical protein
VTDQQSQFALLYGFIRELLELVFEDGHSLFHPFDPGCKLPLVNYAFGIAIDQARHPPLELGDLCAETLWRLPFRTAGTSVTAPVIFPLESVGILQQLTHFLPHRKLHKIRPYLRIGTDSLTTEPIAIGSHTSIIGIRTRTVFAGTGTERFSIIGIPTHFATNPCNK